MYINKRITLILTILNFTQIINSQTTKDHLPSSIRTTSSSLLTTDEYYDEYYDGDPEYLKEAEISVLCEGELCVRKCCPVGTVYDLVNHQCDGLGFNAEWTPKFYTNSLKEETDPPEDIKWVYGFPCDLLGFLEAEVYLMKDGTLFAPVFNRFETVTEYCIDNFVNKTFNIQQGFICFPEKVSSVCKTIKASLLIVSASFLLVSLIVYIVMPDLRNTIHGKVLISYISALMCSYIGLAALQLGSSEMEYGSCYFMHTGVYYTTLTAFFWLNVMSYDVWRTLRSMQPSGRDRRPEYKRIIFYSLYSWGIPLLVVITTILIDKFVERETNFSHPNLGRNGCWFIGMGSWIYMYSFIILAMVINLVFYGMVAKILYDAQSQTKMLRKSNGKDREQWLVYFKLFIVMGITWVFEVISASTDRRSTCGPWIVTDAINSLQGMFIFLVFICKKKNLNKLKKCMNRNKDDTAFSSSSRKTLSSGIDSSTHIRNSEAVTEQRQSLMKDHEMVPLQNEQRQSLMKDHEMVHLQNGVNEETDKPVHV